jgi:ABC-type multidrug transport system fused ATPase/permease subunit
MGHTGSGKTTLIRLLLALVKPKEGEITIYNAGDNRNGSGSANESVLSPRHRCNFVYVPQGNTLLSGTLRQNLLLACPTATDEQMHEALRLACADFVSDLPKGLDTTFSEQGGGLSEGQAQRIAIARALLRPGSIFLLDEATSALDADTERRVLQNILSPNSQTATQPNGQGSSPRTIIIVTHREAAVAYCSQVIKVE